MTTVDTNILLQFIFNVHNLIKVNLNRKKTNNVFSGGGWSMTITNYRMAKTSEKNVIYKYNTMSNGHHHLWILVFYGTFKNIFFLFVCWIHSSIHSDWFIHSFFWFGWLIFIRFIQLIIMKMKITFFRSILEVWSLRWSIIRFIVWMNGPE